MPLLADVTEEFDELRFMELLSLAGPATARELAMRLDEDLTLVAQALIQAELTADRHQLRAQSHILLAIAGTVGANLLCQMSGRLNGVVRAPEGGPFADLLAEIRVLLDRLIARVRLVRRQLAAEA